jgi:hypothetical protein
LVNPEEVVFTVNGVGTCLTELVCRHAAPHEIGFSYFVFGGGSADTLAPVVAALAEH